MISLDMRIVLSALLIASVGAAQEPREAASADCHPPCRRGYLCLGGNCVSECNPPCPDNYLCVDGDCKMDPGARPIVVASPAETRGSFRGTPLASSSDSYEPNHRYIAIGGGGWFLVNHRSEAGDNDTGEVDIEFGSRYVGQAIQLAFPEKEFVLGLGMRVFFPLQAQDHLFIEPQFGLVLNSAFADGGRSFQVGIGPGLRLRYDIFSAFALYVQVFRLDIMVLTYVQPDQGDGQRIDETFVFLNTGGGIEIRY